MTPASQSSSRLPAPAPGGSVRRNDLDWLRSGLFLGLILYHVGLLYAPFSPYFVKSSHSHPAVELALLTTHPWRMALLFLISGAATRFMADKLPAGTLCAGRSMQLLPPLLLGFFLLMPIQAYLMLADTVGYDQPVLDFLQQFFLSPTHEVVAQGRRHPMPVYGHLWFVLYLWGYTALLCAALWLGRRWVGAAERFLERALSGPWMVITPLVVLAVLRFTLFPIFSITLHVQADWYNHAVSFGMFLFGFLIARSERLWTEIARMRWVGLGMAVAGYAAYVGFAFVYGGQPEPLEAKHPLMHLLNAVHQWGASLAVLGFAYRHLRQARPTPAYLNRGLFTFYIVHQPALLLIIHWLKKADIGAGLEAPAVIAMTVAVCLAAYELARRSGWLAPFLGLRLGPRQPRPAGFGGLAAATT